MNTLTEAKRLLPELTEIRRTLHRFPEISGGEIRTTRLIRSRLTELGIDYAAPSENITFAYIGRENGNSIALRADIDALPINEASGVTFMSENPGIMHACGHDAHTAIALCCARLLKERENMLPRRVVIIFQPAEEIGEGAVETVNTGLYKNITEIYAIHVEPDAPAGSVLVSQGPVNMGSGKIRITVNGKTGHGAMPYLCNDALQSGCRIVSDALAIIPRTLPCRKQALLSIGRLDSNGAWNIISDHVEIAGLFRYADTDSEPVVIDRLRKIVSIDASAFGCAGELDYSPDSTPIINDPVLAGKVKAAAFALGVSVLPEPLLTISDDFSEYLKTAKGCYFRAGIGNTATGAETYPLHSCNFRLEESALVNVLAVIAEVLSSS